MMLRYLIPFLIGAFPAFAQMAPWLPVTLAPVTASTYQGPLDVVASPTAFQALRAGSAAIAAAGTQTLVNIRRASDNVACDFLPALTGGFGVTTATCNSSTQGGVSYSTFVGSDGTASCTLAGTTGVCTGATGTIHVNDPVTGVGLTQPCIVATASNTAPTIEIAGTTTSCGTVSVAETFTFQVAGFVAEWYDQSGNSANVTQATAGKQPQFASNCGNAIPCLIFNGAQALAGSIASTSQPFTLSDVTSRVASFTSFQIIAQGSLGSETEFNSTANTRSLFAGSRFTASANDSTFHSAQGVFNGASPNSILVVDNTATTGSPGAGGFGTSLTIGQQGSGSFPMNAYIYSQGVWSIAMNSTQYGGICHNERLFYGTPGSC